MKKFILLLALLAIPVTAFAWTEDECKEVDYNHPDCEQYPQPSPTVTPVGDGPTGPKVVHVEAPNVPEKFGAGVGGASGV